MGRMKKNLVGILITYSILIGLASAATQSSDSSAGPTNMVVDFDSTQLESSLMPGQNGILNLVIKNTGDYNAKNVEVWIPSTSRIHLDKRLYVGQVGAGESKTMPIWLRVDNGAATGLTGIQVTISFDGFDAEGAAENNQATVWEIPVYVYGNPSFQITPKKTTFYKDSLDDLALDGLTLTSVKDLEATLSSSCATIIGSSRKYIGQVASNQNFNLTYQVKPSSSGTCLASLRLLYTDESGSKTSDNVSLGLNVEDAGVDFKVTNVSYSPTGPGEQTDMKITVKNVGSADADDVTVYLDLSSPFAPVGTSEKYLPKIPAGQDVEVDFGLAVGWTADTTSYSIPLDIDYKVGGTSYTINKTIGIDVSGKVILEIMQVQSSGGSIRIDVANIGTRTADGVKATLIISNAASAQQGAFNRSMQAGNNAGQPRANASQFARNVSQNADQQRIISYKSDIKPSKQTTFTFSTSATGPATLEIEYTGVNNERVTQTERITLSGGTSFSGARSNSGSNGGTSTTTIAVAAVVVLVIAYLAYRWLKGRKSR
jgi:hypothetical protein